MKLVNDKTITKSIPHRSELVNAFSKDGPELVKVVRNQWISMEQTGFFYRFFVTEGPLDGAQKAPPQIGMQLMDEPKVISYAWPEFLEIQQSIRGKSGHICYEIRGDLAVTADYQPKSLLNYSQNGIRGLACFFEYLSTQDLMLNEGICHVMTTDKPNSWRSAQVERDGLPVGRPTSIEAWMAGLLKGVIRARDAMKDILPVQV